MEAQAIETAWEKEELEVQIDMLVAALKKLENENNMLTETAKKAAILAKLMEANDTETKK